MANTPENKMGTMPINRLLLSMAAPMAASMLVQALYNIVDSIFVSRLSEDALSAVSLAFPIQMLCISIASGIAVGMNAMLSTSLGAKRFDEANRFAGSGIFIEFISMLLITIIGFLFAHRFFTIQLDDPEIIKYGTDYLFWIMVLSAGIFGQVTGERLLCSTGKTIYAMITQGTGAVINIILDPILIFGLCGFPRLETAGAAIATVIGQFVAAGLSFYFNFRINKEISIKFPYIIKPKLQCCLRILKVGVPSMVMMMVGSVMNFLMNQILLTFNSTAVAVFGVYYKLQSFVFMPVFGLNNGMVPIVSYNYGARHRKRIVGTVKLAMLYATVLMVIGALTFILIPETLLNMYQASPTMIEIGRPALRIIALAFFFAGFCIVGGSAFQALGNGFYSLIVSVARQLLVLLPVAYLFSLTGNLNLVWLAFPIAEIMSVTVTVILLRRIYKRQILPLDEQPAINM